MQNLNIKVASLKEVEEIEKIEKLSFKAPLNRKTLEKELKLPFSQTFLVEKEGKTVAFCTFWKLGEEGEIHRIAVIPEERERGIGRFLLKKVLFHLKKEGVKEVFLEVEENNLPALKLYQKLGFKKIGTRENYYGKGKTAMLLKVSF